MKNKKAINISSPFKLRKTMKQITSALLVPLALFGLIGCGTSQSKATAQPATDPTVNTFNETVNSRDEVKKTYAMDVTKKRSVKVTPIRVPILEYHNSAYVKNWPWSLKPGQFETEMAWLSHHHFHSITLRQFYNAYEYDAKLPSRPVVITFDDGHESNYTMATPILKKYGYTATEFVVTGTVGKRKGILTKNELLAMQKSGIWDIESHSVDHPHLAQLPQKKVVYELTQSKKTLEKLLGKPVQFFCYPYGSYNRQVVKDVKAAGYVLATTVHHGYGTPVTSGLFTLKRLSVHEGLNLNTFASWFQPSLDQTVPLKSKSV